MQRLFSGFPSGVRGSALLLLRLALSGSLVALAIATHAADVELRYMDIVRSLIWLASGVLVGVGFLTPVAQFLVVISLAASPTVEVHAEWLPTALLLVIAVSLGLLGPGAYSVDAYSFGRREWNIPPHSYSDPPRD